MNPNLQNINDYQEEVERIKKMNQSQILTLKSNISMLRIKNRINQWNLSTKQIQLKTAKTEKQASLAKYNFAYPDKNSEKDLKQASRKINQLKQLLKLQQQKVQQLTAQRNNFFDENNQIDQFVVKLQKITQDNDLLSKKIIEKQKIVAQIESQFQLFKQTHQNEIQKYINQISALNQKIQITDLSRQMEKIYVQVETKSNKQIQTIQIQLNQQLKNRDQIIKQQKSQIQIKQNSIKKIKQDQIQMEKKYQKKVKDLTNAFASKNHQYQSQKKKIAQILDQIVQHKKKINENNTVVKQLQNQIFIKNTTINQKDYKIKELQQQIEIQKQQNKQKAQIIQKMQQQSYVKENQLQEKNNNIKKLQANIKIKNNEIKQKKQFFQKVKAQQKIKNKQINELEGIIKKERDTISQLKRQKSQQKQQYQKIIKKINKQQDQTLRIFKQKDQQIRKLQVQNNNFISSVDDLAQELIQVSNQNQTLKDSIQKLVLSNFHLKTIITTLSIQKNTKNQEQNKYTEQQKEKSYSIFSDIRNFYNKLYL